MTDQTPNQSIPTVQDKGVRPPGLLPRNTQAWVIGGISLLMVLVIAFSGRKEPKEPNAASKAQGSVTDPNEARIQEYRARIEEQARKLAAEQGQLAQTRQDLGLYPSPPPVSTYGGNPPVVRARLAEEGYGAPEKGWIETEREKREYQSLFASNVVLSYRPEAKAPERVSAAAQVTALAPSLPAGNQGVASTPAAGLATGTATTAPKDSRDSSATADEDRRTSTARARERDAAIDRADGKDYRLFEGTVIETVLTNRLDGSFSGPVNCMVTTNVYSHDRQKLLIPQGSRVLGEVKRLENFGQERLAVAFHRLIMPDGYSLSLDQFHGLNQIGETGLRDQVNHHYLQVFGVSLAIGAIAGLSQANTRYGVDESAADAYRQGVSNSLSQSSLRILDRYLNVLPTFTIREGQRVKVYLSDDLLLPAYEKHQTPPDL